MNQNHLHTFVLAALFCLTSFTIICAQAPGAGKCIGLDGVSQSLSASTHSGYLPDDSFTAEAWVLPYSIGGVQNIVGNFTTQPSAQGVALQIDNNGNLVLQASQGTFATTGSPISNSMWVHVAAVSTASNVFLYVNGELTATLVNSLPTTATNQPLGIGGITGTAVPGYLNGELDEVRIWNQALSQNEIRDWMCRKVTNNHPAYSNLIGYWRMDETSGNTAFDLSPAGNHATLLNTPMRGWSGAPIGDFSFHSTPSGLPNGSLNASGDTLWIDQASGNPLRIHGYRVDESPNQTMPPNGFTALDTSHYYGIFMVGGSNPTINGRFGFGGNTFFTGTPACSVMVAVRQSGSSLGWDAGIGIPDNTARRLSLSNYPSLQLIPGIRIHPHPVVVSPADTSCIGDSIQLSTSSGAQSYQWLLAGNPIPGANTNQISANTGGQYSLQTTLNGCTYLSDTASLFFNPLPSVSFSTQDSICADEGILILNGGIPSGGFYQGSGISGNQFDPMQSGPGLHTLTYSYTDNAGCSASTTADIYVGLAPVASMDPLPTVCQLDPPVQLTAGSPAGGIYAGAGVTGSQFNPALVGPGLWQVDYILTYTNGCDDTASTLIDVLPAPLTPSLSVAGGTLFSSSPSGNQWYDLSGPVIGATGQVFTPTVDGTYYVVVTDQNGCASDSSNLVPIIANGIMEDNVADLKMWPQPAREKVTVSWMQEQHTDLLVRVWDQTGRMIFQEEIAAEPGLKELEISMENWVDGLYWLQAGSSKPRKLVKAD